MLYSAIHNLKIIIKKKFIRHTQMSFGGKLSKQLETNSRLQPKFVRILKPTFILDLIQNKSILKDSDVN